MPVSRVLLFTGESGAGKSTIARGVCNTLDGEHFSERDLLRGIAAEHSLQRSRELLAHIGLPAMLTALRQATVSRIATASKSLVVIDGVYDRFLPETIRRATPEVKLGLVAVRAEYHIRVARCAQRMGQVSIETATREVAFLDNFKRDAGYDELLATADLVVQNNGAIEQSVDQVVAFAKE